MADAYADLVVDPSDEELARDWSLSAADLEEVRRCRGNENRHRFAVQLCALRVLGHFVDEVHAVPVRIANYVGRQIGRPPVLFLEPNERRATTHEYADLLRAYLGYQTFNEEPLKAWLDERAAEGVAGNALLDAAIRTLRAWKVEAPARSTLERLVRSASARSEEAVWSLLYGRMSPEFCASIDGLLAFPRASPRCSSSSSTRLRRNPVQFGGTSNGSRCCNPSELALSTIRASPPRPSPGSPR